MAEITKDAARPDVPMLTGIRFWAAFFVLLNHLLLGFVSRGNVNFGKMLSMSGVLGMDLFFVLSGFIIHYNYSAKISGSARSFYDFFVARIARLYPLYIFMFAIDFLLCITKRGGMNPVELVRLLPSFLSLSQTWYYAQVANGTPLYFVFPRASITWSISTEMLMYFMYPVFWLFFLRRTYTWRQVVLLAFPALLLMAAVPPALGRMGAIDRLGLLWFGKGATTEAAGEFSFAFWLTFFSPYVRIFQFACGALVADVFIKLRNVAIGNTERIAGQLMVAMSLLFIGTTFLPASIEVPVVSAIKNAFGYTLPIAILLFFGVRHARSIWTKFMSWKGFVSLGERSYSIYLSHIFIYTAVPLMPASNFWRVVVAWVVVFGFSKILYRCIEVPGRTKMRQMLRGLIPGKTATNY